MYWGFVCFNHGGVVVSPLPFDIAGITGIIGIAEFVYPRVFFCHQGFVFVSFPFVITDVTEIIGIAEFMF